MLFNTMAIHENTCVLDARMNTSHENMRFFCYERISDTPSAPLPVPKVKNSCMVYFPIHGWLIFILNESLPVNKPNPMDPLGQVSTRSQPQNSKSRAKAAMGSTIVVLPWDLFGPRKTHDMATFHGCFFREAR